jgi:hypothetical protein
MGSPYEEKNGKGEPRWAALVSGCASHQATGSILTFFLHESQCSCQIFKKKEGISKTNFSERLFMSCGATEMKQPLTLRFA